MKKILEWLLIAALSVNLSWAGGFTTNLTDLIARAAAAAAQTTANTGVTNAAAAQTTANNALPKSGVTDGSAAAAGTVGEVLTAVQSASAALATLVNTNITSILLTPGNWICRGSSYYSSTLATTTTAMDVSLSLSPTTNDSPNSYNGLEASWSSSTSEAHLGVTQQVYRLLNVSVATYIYLNITPTFATSAAYAYGGVICTRFR